MRVTRDRWERSATFTNLSPAILLRSYSRVTLWVHAYVSVLRENGAFSMARPFHEGGRASLFDPGTISCLWNRNRLYCTKWSTASFVSTRKLDDGFCDFQATGRRDRLFTYEISTAQYVQRPNKTSKRKKGIVYRRKNKQSVRIREPWIP